MNDAWHLKQIYALMKSYGLAPSKATLAVDSGVLLEYVLSHQQADGSLSWSWLATVELDNVFYPDTQDDTQSVEFSKSVVYWIVSLLQLTTPELDHVQCYQEAEVDDHWCDLRELGVASCSEEEDVSMEPDLLVCDL